MAKFLLIHGAAHGAWCWSKLISALEARGHQSMAIDLPGNGDDKTPMKDVTLALAAQKVADALDMLGKDSIMVGHSMGGAVITAAAELRPEKLRRLVYLCAFLPQNGQSLRDLQTASSHNRRASMMEIAPDNLSAKPILEVARGIFYSDCSEEDATDALSRLSSQAFAISTTPVAVSPENFGRVPRTYIVCTEDRAIDPEQQRLMAAYCQSVVEIPRGHSPFLSAPDELADILEALEE